MQKLCRGLASGTLALIAFAALMVGDASVIFAQMPPHPPVIPAQPNSTQLNSAQSPPSTAVIVQNLMAANARRAAALRAYQSKRIYKLEYTGFFGGRAEMQVEATYRAPNEKNFKIVSQSGSKLLIREVLTKLLQSEREAQEERNRKTLEISPANYDFNLESTQHTADGDFYVLSVKPRSKNKYVYKGKIWVDARDFAITRMEGSPASNPSFWVKNVEMQYQWTRIGGFWLPVRTDTVTNVRMGGKAVLNITYSDYQITTAQTPAKTAEKNPVLPDPTALTVQPHF
jgi:outer membrane lipoprotein-sorting protein